MKRLSVRLKLAGKVFYDFLLRRFESSFDFFSYLCGYIYLNSLDVNCERSVFIHVPPVDTPYSSQQTSKLILNVLEKCVEQLMDDGKM